MGQVDEPAAGGPTEGGLTILVAGIDTLRRKNLYQYAGLARYGHRFVVVTPDALQDSDVVVKGAANLELRRVAKRFSRTSYLLTILRLLLTRRFDVAEMYPDSWLHLAATVLLRLRGIRVIVIARGSADYACGSGNMPRGQRMAYRGTYRLANLVVYKEHGMAPLLRKMGLEQIRLLPNAVPPVEAVPRRDHDQCCFLYLNRVVKSRSPRLALEAFLRVSDELRLTRDSPIRLRIVGLHGGRAGSDMEQEASLRQMVEGRNVPVELHPWSPDPDKWLSEADVFVLPAENVFLNYGLLEAMARAIPPIVQTTADSERIVTPGVDGYVLPPVVEAWARHMRRLIEDPQLRRRLGEAARTKVSEQYSHAEYCTTYDQIYREISARPTFDWGAKQHGATP
jgi:glycosyltransferase involved in cell wall biosynthesis